MPDEAPDHADTLEAYRRQKWAQLHDEGAAGLRRELANLDHFIRTANEDEDWVANILPFRRAKARVLRAILAEAGSP